jgi:adenine-specific DNA-methyltransferase
MSKKLEEYTKEELLSYIGELKKVRRFGLVWEAKDEQVVIDCDAKLPVLQEVTDRKIDKADDNEPTNLLIEGDNFHSLTILNYTHAGKIDAIYADPPYNTGNTSWIYNNKIIDGNDMFRHSKWLSFMDNRLRLAKVLLKDNGIIVVTIDDYEMATLTLLMNDIFGEENHLGTVVIKNNPSGRSTASGFSIAHEYALFYGKQPTAKIGRLQRTESQISRYKEKDEVSQFEWVNFRKHGGFRKESPRMFYPIYINTQENSISIPELQWDVSNKVWEVLQEPKSDEYVVYPVDDLGKERRWKWSIERARLEISEMKVGQDRNKKPAVYIKARMKNEGMLPLTWWDKSEYSATSHGTNLLTKIMPNGDRFDYPKSLHAVKDSLRILSENKNGIFLDFFAGSGTTGHAVLKLNEEDGGKRQFILCTNNENGIAENITYERIKKVIDGYADEDGIPANLRYFKTDFVDTNGLSILTDKDKLEITKEMGAMIALRENSFDQVEQTDHWQTYENATKLTAIYFCEDKTYIQEYLDKLNAQDKPVKLYVFGWGKNAGAEYASKKISVEDIPEPLIEVYKEIAK